MMKMALRFPDVVHIKWLPPVSRRAGLPREGHRPPGDHATPTTFSVLHAQPRDTAVGVHITKDLAFRAAGCCKLDFKF